MSEAEHHQESCRLHAETPDFFEANLALECRYIDTELLLRLNLREHDLPGQRSPALLWQHTALHQASSITHRVLLVFDHQPRKIRKVG